MNEEVFNTLAAFTKKSNQGTYAYILAMQDKDGKVSYHERSHQPCFGEMRIYDTPWKPSDLRHPFPEGNPIGIGVNLITHYGVLKHSLWSYVTGKESLWWPLLKDRFVQTDTGFVMTDTNFDSDYWFSFLLSLRRLSSNGQQFNTFKKAAADNGVKVSSETIWVAAMQTKSFGGPVLFLPANQYSMAFPCSWKNLLNKTPLSFQGGTFFERKTLRHMPDNMASRIWSGDDSWKCVAKRLGKDLPKEIPLKEFVCEYLPALETFK